MKLRLRQAPIAASLIFAISTVIIAGVPLAAAQTAAPDADAHLTPEAISDWMIGYYQAPQPRAAPRVFARALEIDMFSDGRLTTLMGFMTGYFRENPNQLKSSLDAARGLSLDEQQIILASARLATREETPEATALDARLDAKGRKLLSMTDEMGIHAGDKVEPVTPFAQRFIWGFFFATGDTRSILPIITAMVPSAKSGPDREIQLIMGNVAELSLGAMALEHKTIRDFCKAQIAKQPPEIAAKLQKIIDRVDAQ